MDGPRSVYPPTDPSIHPWTLGLFPPFTVNTMAMNMRVHVSVWTYVFISLELLPRRGSARSHGNSTFN